MSSNWSCILYQQHIVIHCEESDAAYQHFYPLSLLSNYVTKLSHARSTPVISRRVSPARTLKKKFIFPLILDNDPTDSEPDLDSDPQNNIFAYSANIPIQNGNGESSQQTSSSSPSSSSSSSSSSTVSSSSSIIPAPASSDNSNPYPFPPWYPESAHFVRQWWPSLPNIPRVSCTVVLLAAHDPHTHRTRFVLAQHYFRVPLDHMEWNDGLPPAADSHGKRPARADAPPRDAADTAHPARQSTTRERAQDDALMNLWYVSTPFEVVRVLDDTEDDDPDGMTDRPRPLVAVDFGHAVWVEYLDTARGGATAESAVPADGDPKCLRFVTFPPYSDDFVAESGEGGVARAHAEAEVRTLETPAELDLATVETINIDQSQGAIILSDKTGRTFILCYE